MILKTNPPPYQLRRKRISPSLWACIQKPFYLTKASSPTHSKTRIYYLKCGKRSESATFSNGFLLSTYRASVLIFSFSGYCRRLLSCRIIDWHSRPTKRGRFRGFEIPIPAFFMKRTRSWPLCWQLQLAAIRERAAVGDFAWKQGPLYAPWRPRPVPSCTVSALDRSSRPRIATLIFFRCARCPRA